MAEEGISIDRGVTVDGGGVAVRTASEGPYLTSAAAELVLARDVRVTDQAATVAADTVRIDRDVQVPNLAHNDGTVVGTVTGTTTSPIALPLDVAMPTPPQVVAGTDDITVSRGTIVTLEPGAYGRLDVARDATLRLADGDYVFASVQIARNVTVTFTAATSLAVVGPMALDREVTLVPAEEATPTHAPLAVTVLAADGDATRPAADPAVRIGRDGDLDLSVLAPAGTVTVDRGTALRGSIIAVRIALARDVHVTYAASSSAAPVVVLDEPRDGATVGGQVTLRASETAGADLARVDFVVDSVIVGSATSAPFELLWDASALPDGEHTIAAIGVDQQGRTGTSGTATVMVAKESDPQSRLADDLTSGAISLEEYVTFGVYRWSEPDRVPATYQVTGDFDASDLTVPLAMSLAFLSDLDPATQTELREYLSPESAVDREVVPLTDEEMDAALAPLWAEFEGAGPVPEEENFVGGMGRGSLRGALTAAPLAAAEDEPQLDASFGTVTCGQDRWPQTLMRMNSIVLDCTYDTRLATFYWTDQPGPHDIPWTDVRNAYLYGDESDPQPNRVPDEIDVVASSFYQASAAYRGMGYANPPKVMVGVADYGGAGLAIPELGLVFVDRGMPVYEGEPRDTGTPVYLARHELFHQFQYQYQDWSRIALDYGAELNSTTGWWLEATAEWAAHKAQNAAWGRASESTEFTEARNKYASRLAHHLGEPAQALATFNSPLRHPGAPRPQYGSFLFAEYLEERFGESVILQTWQEQMNLGPRAMTSIRNVIEERGVSFEDVIADYHEANYRIVESYRDSDAHVWVGRLAATNGRPDHEVLVLEPGDSFTLTPTIEAGGAAYIDLEVRSTNPDGVTFDLSVDAGDDPAAGHLRTQIEYADDYPSRCFLVDPRPVTHTPGHAEHSTTIAPSCSLATVIVSHTGADVWGLRGNDEQVLTPRITVTAHITTAETVVEHWSGYQHNRVNVGADLDRMLTSADDFSARLEIDMGSAVSEGRHGFALYAYTVDRAPRSADVIWVNGTRLELEHRRIASVDDGRYGLAWGGNPWPGPALSWWTIPDELVTDGPNVFEIVLQGRLYVYGAYIFSHPYYEPDPDPDPDPCPDCPVAT